MFLFYQLCINTNLQLRDMFWITGVYKWQFTSSFYSSFDVYIYDVCRLTCENSTTSKILILNYDRSLF